MFWSYGSQLGGKIVVLSSTAVLARLLSPSDFGLVGLALVFLSLVEILLDLGVGQVLVMVRDDKEVEDKAETAFVFSVFIGLVLTVVMAVLGPAASSFFDEPELKVFLPAVGSILLLRSLSSTHYALAQRSMDFQSRTAAELVELVTRGIVGIGLAVAGAGAWSLVAGYAAGAIGFAIALWATSPWRPHLRPSMAHLRSMLPYGGSLTAVSVLAAIISNLDYVFVGKVLGTTALGLYTLAFKLPEVLVLNLSVVAARVLFPAFSSMDRQGLARAFLRSLRYTLTVGLPLAAGLILLGEPAVLLAFGERWEASVVPMQVLAFYALAVTAAIPAGTILKAVGRADVLLKLAIPRTVMLLGLLVALTDRGVVVVAACQATMAVLFDVLGTGYVARILHIGARPIWLALRPPLTAAAGMVAVVLPASTLIEPLVPRALVGVTAGGVVYLALLWRLAGDDLRELRAMLARQPEALALAPPAPLERNQP